MTPPLRGPSTTVERVLRAPLDQVFELSAAGETLPQFLLSYGPIPAIERVDLLQGKWGVLGADRHVHLKGGGRVREEVTAFDPPRSFAYSMGDYEKTPLKLLARRAWSEWKYEAVPEGTRVTWFYVFEPRSVFTRPLLSFFVHVIYRGFMAQSLRLLEEKLKP